MNAKQNILLLTYAKFAYMQNLRICKSFPCVQGLRLAQLPHQRQCHQCRNHYETSMPPKDTSMLDWNRNTIKIRKNQTLVFIFITLLINARDARRTMPTAGIFKRTISSAECYNVLSPFLELFKCHIWKWFA